MTFSTKTIKISHNSEKLALSKGFSHWDISMSEESRNSLKVSRNEQGAGFFGHGLIIGMIKNWLYEWLEIDYKNDLKSITDMI